MKTLLFIAFASLAVAAYSQDHPTNAPAVQGKILSVVTLDYNRDTDKGGSLSSLGEVKLGKLGIIEGVNGKSGWVNINTTGTFTDKTSGSPRTIQVLGVSFWVNKGGKNWWDFSVREVKSLSEKWGRFGFGRNPTGRCGWWARKSV